MAIRSASQMLSVSNTFLQSLRWAATRSFEENIIQNVGTQAKIINGNVLAKQIKLEIRDEVQEWVAAGNKRPHLTAIIVGDDPASHTYVRNKMKATEFTGISSETIRLPDTVSQPELLKRIHELNECSDVDGILVQLPVPKHISERAVCNAVCPEKDVDGFNIINIGRLCSDLKALVPATAAGVMEMIKRSGIETFGKNAVVCGRSKNVGLPIAVLLHADGIGETKAGDATTTICHRYTPPDDLRRHLAAADILVVATGIPHLIKGDMVKEGVAVIDVGITRIKDPETGKAKLVGDVDFEAVSEKASFITPVPGGVGPMTVAMLMKNTLLAAKKEIDYNF
ncbi:bifunctional methylenetetrahydrofolate dehydrogenase/cyclohydrolase, mitochondrial-like [Lingula anatina]|uniref:methenyltetrahydrofolate cyclohydrolase n=1 Tax=Lingula anatina TaxID=7574 RepID=A0A1S3HGZ1_LINAN|nr:bifunctional methylenetetrahydrofolate dehydrogenase/cyclohydrolase, mitochondrial-like [Lingula anatina]|eukprot:XP_013384761.1 bifunctional methylenetetrahydrofolate dehydrogenase/cyclohydrolase, mitochondrial-like [Lingula anatina]